MRFTHTIPCFDLSQIAQSGQCFRMHPLPPEFFSGILPSAGDRPPNPPLPDRGFSIVSRDRLLFILQEGQEITLLCEESDHPFWLSYLDLERDYQAVIRSINPKDDYLAAAAQAGSGIRILAQDPWEMIITFLISQQKTIPAIQSLVEALSRTYGKPMVFPGRAFYSFPTPEELSQASLEDLQALKLGYRAKYIYRICQDALSGSLDLEGLKQMEYGEAMEYLTGFYGIGKKVANCICLFGLHQIGAFPIDTWIEKILMEHYYDKKKYRRIPKAHLLDRIVEDSFGPYGGNAGIMQQYIFYYERLLQNKIRII